MVVLKELMDELGMESAGAAGCSGPRASSCFRRAPTGPVRARFPDKPFLNPPPGPRAADEAHVEAQGGCLSRPVSGIVHGAHSRRLSQQELVCARRISSWLVGWGTGPGSNRVKASKSVAGRTTAVGRRRIGRSARRRDRPRRFARYIRGLRTAGARADPVARHM